MSAPVCRVCQRTLRTGETALAEDWKVIDARGVRLETRYTCAGCEGES